MADFFENAEQQSATMNSVLLPSDEGNQVFGAYTNNVFLNTQKILNATNFFTFAPTEFYTYYWTLARRNLEWFYGFVWGVHNNGILSSQMGSKICKMASNLTISGGYYFQGTPRAEQFLTNFDTKRQILAKLKQKLPMLNACGFMLAKLDCDINGNLDMNFVQGNRYFAKTDDQKRVLAFYAVIVTLTADVTANENLDNADQSQTGYYLVEERYLRKGQACQRYKIYRGPIIATSPIFTSGGRGEPFERLPGRVQDYIVKRFGKNILGKEILLPFGYGEIGAEIVFNSFSSTGMDEYTCFSDSTLQNIQTQLYELDWTKTIKNENKYIAQDFVAMPEELTGVARRGYDDETREIAKNLAGVAGFNKRLVKASRLRDPEKSIPFVYHPQVLTDIYNNDIRQILNEIAMNTQFSPVTLAGFLGRESYKTATEVAADENATRLTIENKRTLISDALNRLWKIVLRHYGIDDDCVMVFKAGSLNNPQTDINVIRTKLENGIISRETAILDANPQFTRREAREEYERIKREGGAIYQSGSGTMDDIL